MWGSGALAVVTGLVFLVRGGTSALETWDKIASIGSFVIAAALLVVGFVRRPAAEDPAAGPRGRGAGAAGRRPVATGSAVARAAAPRADAHCVVLDHAIGVGAAWRDHRPDAGCQADPSAAGWTHRRGGWHVATAAGQAVIHIASADCRSVRAPPPW